MNICKVKDCNNKHYSKGYCNKHYQQFRKYGEDLLQPKEQTLCSVKNCNEKHYAKNYCKRHYDIFNFKGGQAHRI